LARISLPADFSLAQEASFRLSVNFPPIKSFFYTKKNNQLQISLSFNDTITASDFALSFPVITPSMTPLIRTVSIELLDSSLAAVVDASYTLLAPKTFFGFPVVPFSDSTLFKRDDQSAITSQVNLTTQQEAAVLSSQNSAFREYFKFFIKGDIKVSCVTRIIINFPESVVPNIAYTFIDPETLGFSTSPEFFSRIESVTISPEKNSLIATLSPDWPQLLVDVDSFLLSVSVVLPEYIPLPAFNIYVVAFADQNNILVEYPFWGHSLKDYPSA
jgi:hypothetical protein